MNLSGAAFGASNYMMQIMGYAPIEPDGSVRIEVPADVAFRVSILDANARRLNSQPPQGVWLQLIPGEVVSCNGCHLPGSPQHPISHGRDGLFASAWAGAAAAGVPFPHTLGANSGGFVPTSAGETMAETRAAVSCATDTPPCLQMQPTMDVIYTDVWDDPAQVPAANLGAPIDYSYISPTQPIQNPTSALCETTWASNCLAMINYPEHIQPLWDAARPVTVNGAQVNETCSQAGCHNSTPSGTTAVPAGNLDLTSTASNTVPQEFTSYVQLLFPHNTVIMGQPGTVGRTLHERGQRQRGPVRAVLRDVRVQRPACGLDDAGRASSAVGMAGYWRTVLQQPVRSSRSGQLSASLRRAAAPSAQAPPPRWCWHGC